MGDKQVPELLNNLPTEIRARVKKVDRNLVFHFGNHQTLTSKVALVFPVRKAWFRIPIAPGQSPMSSAFLRTIQAVIDAGKLTL